MDWSAVIVAALTGSASGFAASTIAPWANWGVEKHRLRHEARVALINSARDILNREGYRIFTSTAEYSQLRPMLDKELVKTLEQGRVMLIGSSTRTDGDAFAAKLLDEISKIEREWNLL